MTTLIDFCFQGNRAQALITLMRLYPSYSIKRKLLKGLNALNQVGPRLLPGNMSRIGDIEPNVLPALRPKETRAFLLHKIDQNGRCYVFHQDAGGRLSAITKLALHEGAAKGIRREAVTLKSLAGRTSFNIPKVQLFEDWDGGCALRISAVPHGQEIYNKAYPLPDALFNAVAALRPKDSPKLVPAQQIAGWTSALVCARTPAICEVAMDIDSEAHFSVSAAHRDLGSENIFCYQPAKTISDFTLIDWEFFTETAPVLTDRVGVWLGCRHRTLKGLRKINVNILAASFLADFDAAPGGRSAAVLALLHLAEMGIDLAQILTGDARRSV